MCGDSTSHLLYPLNPHRTHPLSPHLSPPTPSTLLLPLSLISKTLPSPRTSPAPSALPPTLPFLTLSTADTSQPAALLPNYPSETHPSLFTVLGHLDVVRQNLRSSKTPPFQPSLALASLRSSTHSLWDSLDPTSLDCPLPSSVLFLTASDLTGQLPVESRRGNKYILITNFRGYIHFTPKKSKSPSDYVRSFASILAFLPLLLVT